VCACYSCSVEYSPVWYLSDRCDPDVRPLADRHYNRQSHGAPNFVPPGRCLVLKTGCLRAFWVTSWPYAEYVKHAWAGAWICSAFRNEGVDGWLSSAMIREAVACALGKYKKAPVLGMVTFVDCAKVRSKRDPGYCYLMAGFRKVGYTKGGLLALQMKPGRDARSKNGAIGPRLFMGYVVTSRFCSLQWLRLCRYVALHVIASLPYGVAYRSTYGGRACGRRVSGMD
jgi:hypothetical protein